MNLSQYHTLTGTVKFLEPSLYLRIDDTEIPIQDLCNLTGDMFKEMELPC